MPLPRVVIIGGGFAGLNAAKRLSRKKVALTLIDRTNHHLFQPLLYQVATGGLSPANIAVPLRSLFRRQRQTRVVCDAVTAINLSTRVVHSETASYPFAYAILAAGGETSYYGNDGWRHAAPGLKTLEDARTIRARVLSALETAEADPSRPRPCFVLAGGGPTGVEMAGAIAELTRQTLRGEFRAIDPATCPILLVEPSQRVLGAYPPALSESAQERLTSMGVDVRLGARIADVRGSTVTLRRNDGDETIDDAVTIWAAGVRASPLAEQLAEQAGVEADRAGRVPVEPDLSVAGHPNVFAIGDLSVCRGEDGEPLPGVAPVAIQQGEHAAKMVERLIAGEQSKPFRYRDYGSMAVIGRGAAVAEIGGRNLSGFTAWLAWLFVHLLQLVGYQNRLLVAMQWAWNYFTRNRSARLVTGGEHA